MSEQVMQRLKVKVMGSYFCLRQHFHNDRNEEEDNCSVEVESAEEKNGLLEKRENFEGDNDQDTGERASYSLGQGCCKEWNSLCLGFDALAYLAECSHFCREELRGHEVGHRLHPEIDAEDEDAAKDDAAPVDDHGVRLHVPVLQVVCKEQRSAEGS